ncbi:unnamed protein product [Adineta steineri]|uniref:Uncharacterized protein n=1 Tax=Adineta steineri TaxID=433720 RepID=A0A814R8L1_9BILA|nr:unnamed protein product [Adineta steineri]CAF1442926.1 unnamed protein product [Adineta steineri]
MSSNTGVFDTSLPETNRSIQVSDLDEPDYYCDKFRQHSFLKQKSIRNNEMNVNNTNYLEKQTSIISDLTTQISSIEYRLPLYNNENEYYNLNNTTYQLCAMIIGSVNYKHIIKPPYELFKLFLYSFHSSNTVKDFIQNIFDFKTLTQTKTKIYPSVCVIYQNHRLDQNEYLSTQVFQSNLIVYILLIPTNTNQLDNRSYKKSLEFYDPPNLCYTSDIYIRICEKNLKNNFQKKMIRIKNLNRDITIKKLKNHIWKMLNITKEYNCRIYYYGYELFDDVRPLSPDFTLFIHPKNLPTIFDFVLIHIQIKSTINQNTQLSYIHVNMENNILNDENDNDNSTDLWETDYETFFRNYALIYYIRLCIYVAISNRNSMKMNDELIEDVDYFLSGNCKKSNCCDLNEVLLDLYEFCDKDKCNKLDKEECETGLLILFKYLNENLMENKLNIETIYPLINNNDGEENVNNEYYSKENFEMLIIDTLSEHVRTEIFQYPEYSQLKEFSFEITKQIECITDNIDNILNDELKFLNDNQKKNPFIKEETIKYTLLFLFSLIILPITILILLIIKIQNSRSLLLCPNRFLRYLIISILFLISLLISSMIYLIVLNVIFYHIYSKDIFIWKINLFEVYCPLFILIYLIFISYVYLFDKIILNSNEKKDKKFQKIYNDVQIEILKYNIQIRTTNQQQIENLSKNCFTKIYKNEFENEKFYIIIFKIICFLLIVSLSILHTCLPILYRSYSNEKIQLNQTKPFEIQLIEICFFIFGFPFYFLFILMIIYGLHKYDIFYYKINEMFQKISNDDQYRLRNKNSYDFNFKIQNHVHLFILLLKQLFQINQTVEYQIARLSLLTGLIISFILIIYSIFNKFNRLTNIFLLFDIILLSILILIYLFRILSINKMTQIKLIEIIMRTKYESICKICKYSQMNLNYNIDYLNSISEYLNTNKYIYSIHLFQFNINQTTIFIILIITIIGIMSTLFPFI